MPITINVPGSKSITNRILILAALSRQQLEINGRAHCDDSDLMIQALKTLGYNIEEQGSKLTLSAPTALSSQKPLHLHTGLAGTTTRFLSAFCCTLGQEIFIDVAPRMSERPIKPLTQALQALGADIQDQNGCPPLHIGANKLKGGRAKIAGDLSSQYISALLMALPFAGNDSEIIIEGQLVSQPYIAMTLQNIADFGLKITNRNFTQFYIPGQQKCQIKSPYQIEVDASGASYIGAYSALHPEKEILIANLHSNYLQGDIAFLDYLKKIGCTLKELSTGIIVKGPEKLQSLGTVDMNSTPDLVMTFAALAMFTPGKTRITNIANLRIKESDRLAALENEISKFGLQVQSGPDYIEIEGNPELPEKIKEPINIATYEDHRMAMCFGMLQDLLPLSIENPDCVAKSYPTFWQDIQKLINHT